MAKSSAALQRELDDTQARLRALPPVHHVDQPHLLLAKEVAIRAHIDYLQRELSTARVQEAVQAVQRARILGTTAPEPTRAPSDPELALSTAAPA